MQNAIETGKRAYTTPQLMMHGTLEQMTKLIDKDFGATDGFSFQGAPIGNVS